MNKLLMNKLLGVLFLVLAGLNLAACASSNESDRSDARVAETSQECKTVGRSTGSRVSRSVCGDAEDPADADSSDRRSTD